MEFILLGFLICGLFTWALKIKTDLNIERNKAEIYRNYALILNAQIRRTK
jgi:hypothetical protein